MRTSDRILSIAWKRVVVAVVAATLVWAGAPAPQAQASPGRSVDLQVLLVTDGGTATAALATLMDREGVPYTTISLGQQGRQVIDAGYLATGTRGHFQAVILPNHEGGNTGSPTLSSAEMTALADYETTFGVRQVDALTWSGGITGVSPAYSGSIDGAQATVTDAGLTGPFTYLKGEFTIDNFDPGVSEVSASLLNPATAPAGTTYTSLVNVNSGGHSGSIVGVFSHDFREELVITAAYNSSQEWFNEVGHGILTWMTRGIHLGHHRNYFAVHVDDIFMADGRWDSVQHCTPGDTPSCLPNTVDIRMDEDDVDRLVGWQNANDFTLDMLFNAKASVDAAAAAPGGIDPLTARFLDVQDEFTWVNHTYSHAFLGCIQVQNRPITGEWHCKQPGEVVDEEDYYDPEFEQDAAEYNGFMWMSQAQIYDQISQNQAWAVAHSLNGFDSTALVTGEHSGLKTAPEQEDDNPFLAAALTQAGIAYTGSDASREPAARAVDGANSTTRTLPRYPMNIFYNAATYSDEVNEYNWIYTAGGSGLCTAHPETTTCIQPLDASTPTAAQASFTNYIVPLEVRNAYGKVITNDPRPFYAHQSNLAEDGILYPVLEGVLNNYKSTYDTTKSPIITDDLVSLGETLDAATTWNAVKSGVHAYIDATGVHVSGVEGTDVPLTVPTGTTGSAVGSFTDYDGELSGWFTASASDTLVAVPPVTLGGYVGHATPDSPAPVTAVPASFLGAINLSWSAPANDGGSPITGYVIERSLNTPVPEWGDPLYFGATANSWTADGLQPGTEYIFRIRATNAVGSSAFSEASAPVTTLAVPGVPAPVTAVPGAFYGAINLSWSAPATDGGSPITGYVIERSLNTPVPTWGDALYFEHDDASYVVSGLVQGAEYIFRIRATNAVGTSEFSQASTPVAALAPLHHALPTVSQPDVVYGNPVTIALTVATAEGDVPSGTVTLTINGGSQQQAIVGDTATFSVPGLQAGSYAYTLAYAGDPGIESFTWPGTVTVTKATAVVTGSLVTAPTPQEPGTYQVSVAPPTGLATPTGQVTLTLTNGAATTTVEGTLDNGTVTLDLPSLAEGTWTATVDYAGDSNYDAATAVGAPVTSTDSSITVAGSVGSAPSPQQAGSYEVTVTAVAGHPAPTGNVTLTLGAGPDARTFTVQLTNGAATIALPALAAGTWAASIAYSGDDNYAATNVAGASVVSAKADVTAIGEVGNASSPQSAGTYKVTVNQPNGLAAPTGDVTLTLTNGDSTKTVHSALTGGIASFDLPILDAGTWTVSAEYSGDANYRAATIAGESVVSVLDPVTVTGVVGLAPTPQSAGTYAVTVEPQAGSAAPTGDVTVTFTRDGSDPVVVEGTLTSGGVALNVGSLAVGVWQATIVYAGDANYAGTTAVGEAVVSTTALVSVAGEVGVAPSPQHEGSYIITVTQPAEPADLDVPSGNVTLTLTNGVDTQTVTGHLIDGTVTVVLPSLAAGSWAATIAYSGDDNYASAPAPGESVVSVKDAVTVAGAVVKNPTTVAAGSYKVTVTAPSGLVPATGAVSVTLQQGTVTKVVSGALAAGTATIVVPMLPAGAWTASVAYAGDAHYAPNTTGGPSTTSAKVAVSKVTTTVVKKPTSTAAGSYKVTVTQPTGLAKATGTVTVVFKKGTATTTVSGTLASGVATIAVPRIAAGTWTAAVAYAGDATYTAKTATGSSLAVVKGGVSKITTKVTKRPTTKKAGSYTVTVTQPTGMAKATGKVTLTLKKGKVTKKVTGSLKSGAVTLKVPKLPNGVWKASVSYAGNTTYTAKKVAGLYVVVGKTKVSKISTSITKMPTTTAAGTYKVTVSHGAGLPTVSGKVTLTLKKGKVTKKVTGTLKSGVVTLKVPKLAKGVWKASVTYKGSSVYTAKTSAGKYVVVGKTKVSKITTAVTKKPTTKAAGKYKVTVSHGTGLPTVTGTVTVTIKKGSVAHKVQGTLKSGVVTVVVPKLAKGTWKVSVTYAGSTVYVKTTHTGKSIVVTK